MTKLDYVINLWNTIKTNDGFDILNKLNRDKHKSFTFTEICKWQSGYSSKLNELEKLCLVIPTYLPQSTDNRKDGKSHRIKKGYSISYIGIKLMKNLSDYDNLITLYETNCKAEKGCNNQIREITYNMYNARKEQLENKTKKEDTRYLFEELTSRNKYFIEFMKQNISIAMNSNADFKSIRNRLNCIDWKITSKSPIYKLTENYLENRNLFFGREEILINNGMDYKNYRKDTSKFYNLKYIDNAFNNGALMTAFTKKPHSEKTEELLGFTLLTTHLIKIFEDTYDLYNTEWYRSIEKAKGPIDYIQIQLFETLIKDFSESQNNQVKLEIFTSISHNSIFDFKEDKRNKIERSIGDHEGGSLFNVRLNAEYSATTEEISITTKEILKKYLEGKYNSKFEFAIKDVKVTQSQSEIENFVVDVQFQYYKVREN
jgi:hypothetical protein